MKSKLFLSACLLVSSWASTVDPFNDRPVTLGGTHDLPSVCTSFGSPSCNLYDLLPALGANPWSMSNVGLFSASTDFQVSYLAEITAGASTQSLGIWSGVEAHQLFGPSATGGETVFLNPSLISSWGIDPNAFGFYLATFSNPLHLWMLTLDEFNLGGEAQALVHSTPGGAWFIGFEDLIRNMGDNDYNDAVIRVVGIDPAAQVPEPEHFLAVGLALLGMWLVVRKGV